MSDEKKAKLRVIEDTGADASRTLKQLDDVFSVLEQQCFESFSNSDLHDDRGRFACRVYMKVMADVKDRLTVAVRNGESARKELIELTNPTFRKRKVY